MCGDSSCCLSMCCVCLLFFGSRCVLMGMSLSMQHSKLHHQPLQKQSDDATMLVETENWESLGIPVPFLLVASCRVCNFCVKRGALSGSTTSSTQRHLDLVVIAHRPHPSLMLLQKRKTGRSAPGKRKQVLGGGTKNRRGVSMKDFCTRFQDEEEKVVQLKWLGWLSCEEHHFPLLWRE